MNDYKSPGDKLQPQREAYGTIEYYRVKSAQEKYFQTTITFYTAPHLEITVYIGGTISPTKQSEHIEQYRYANSIGKKIMIYVNNAQMPQYQQVNTYVVQETEIVFDEEHFDTLFTFVPIELINLEQKR